MIKHKQKFNYSMGFTIVELLLYMGLFMGFLTILSGLFVSTLDSQTDSTTISHTDQDAWYLMNRFEYDLYRADSVITPANNGDVSDSLVIDVDGSLITYSLVGDSLFITQNSQTDKIVSGEVTVSNLSFKRLGNESGLATITVEAQLQNSIVGQIKDFDITIGIRQ